MKRYLIIVILLSIGFATFCQIDVIPVTKTDLQIKKNAILYSLPKAVFYVNVTVKTDYFVPGPYNKYADKYLTIRNVRQESETTSDIINVKINSISEPDPASTYFVFSKNKEMALSYAGCGVIKAYGDVSNCESVVNSDLILNIPQYLSDDVKFLDLSVKRNFTNITDTTYKVIEIDSIFQKIPVYNKSITSKEFEQKAEEAANFIVKIRKRKFKLVSGQFESETPPKNVDEMIAELDKIENEYLSLFVGKTVSITNNYYFRYSPDGKNKDEKLHVFNLSDKLGITDIESADAEPVYLEVKNFETALEINRFYNRQEKLKDKEKEHGLYYRVPGYGSVKLVFDGHTYAEQVFMVPQFGYTNYLPAKMFKNKHLKIIFDENSGLVKSITNE